MAETTILHHLERHARTQGSATALRDKLTGTWRTTSWSEYNDLTRQVARAMIGAGIGEGDVVTILGANRPEWVISALGAMRSGGVSAGVYTTCSAEEIGYIVQHSESPLLIVETLEQLGRVLEVWDKIPSLKNVVLMRDAGTHEDPRVHGWDDFLASGDSVDEAEVDARLAALRRDQVADFIYTSGTTGPPKAVMLTHENLEWTGSQLADAVKLTDQEVALSYLPLSHIAEQTASMLMALVRGYQVHFCDDGLQLAGYLKETRPTIFFGVPRVWERFEAGIKAQLGQATGMKAKIADWARSVSSRHIAEQNAGRTPNALLAAQYNAADKVVLSKIHAALGFDRCRVIVSGAAPIPAATLEFFASVGIPVLELYGQSEDTGPTTTNLPGKNRFGTVGQALDGVEVKIAEDGEILVRGKNVFAGYYKNDEATAETLIDGWLHSGDLGKLDDDGYLSIIGRKKDIIITSGGKNIAPQNIEEALAGIDIVGTPVVVGDKQRFLVALLTLQPEAAGRFAEEHGIDPSAMHDDPVVRAHLEEAIAKQVNPLMARVEHIRNFVVLPNEFSTDGGELTPTFKVKRNVVNEMYADQIAATYDQGQVL
ncbi:MAG: long-chain acyl-CoA synthetase [Verrucomicrobiales bacterium]|jgi:long-chain acyl-CoA synthetase